MRIGIVGGGIAGLACAHYLLKSGHTPVVFEAEANLGGLGSLFSHNGVGLDRMPHTLLDSDSALCGLMADLGSLGQLTWKETRRALVVDQQLYPWESPRDLLRFDAIGLNERIRAGLANLYLTKARRYGLDLDKVSAADWLRKLFGATFFERIWAPLLRAQFGEHLEEAPAYWAWRMLNRHMRGHREVRGYIRGGFGWLTEQLHASIEGRGGEIRVQSRVTGLYPDENGGSIVVDATEHRFDAVISTLAFPLLRQIAGQELLREIPGSSLDYQGIRSAVLVTRAPLERFYTTSVTDDSLPFHTIVETTHVVPPSCTGGYNLVYLMNRSGPESESHQLPDDVVRKESIEGLKAVYPHFDPLDVEEVYVFRTAHAAPIWTVGYLDRTPPLRVKNTRLYLCMSAQVYPRIPSWDSSVALSRETANKVAIDLA